MRNQLDDFIEEFPIRRDLRVPCRNEAAYDDGEDGVELEIDCFRAGEARKKLGDRERG